MFLSTAQVQESISRLQKLNPFFGTAFLAFKKAEIPVGTTETVVFSRIVEDILQTYYRPTINYSGFYSPFRTSDPTKRWNKARYGSTSVQRVTTDAFEDALIHPKESQKWGWKPDYINVLESHLSSGLIPAFDLAVWLFRDKEWDNLAEPADAIQFLFHEFNVTPEEQQLFDLSTANLSDFWLGDQRITTEELLDIIGDPPGTPLEEGVTLSSLKLNGVGPAEHTEFEPASRMNLITGDNGLGKTFLLELV